MSEKLASAPMPALPRPNHCLAIKVHVLLQMLKCDPEQYVELGEIIVLGFVYQVTFFSCNPIEILTNLVLSTAWS
jgi:hypothetical protein